MHPDHLAARLARTQHGAFARAQLIDEGITPGMIRSRLSSGLWVAVDSAVYALPSQPDTWLRRVSAAILGQPGSVASGLTAAGLWEIGGAPRSGPIEITVAPHAHHSSRIARVHRSKRIERRSILGLAVQSPPVVALEVANRVSLVTLGRLVDDAVIKGYCRFDHVGEWIVRCAGSRLPGVAKLRRVMLERGTGDPPTESELESRTVAVLGQGPLPRLIRQVRFSWRDNPSQRVDFQLEGTPILIEADGRPWHARYEQMAEDRRRDREALVHGLLTVRLVWMDLNEQAERCLRDVQAIHARFTTPA